MSRYVDQGAGTELGKEAKTNMAKGELRSSFSRGMRRYVEQGAGIVICTYVKIRISKGGR